MAAYLLRRFCKKKKQVADKNGMQNVGIQGLNLYTYMFSLIHTNSLIQTVFYTNQHRAVRISKDLLY